MLQERPAVPRNRYMHTLIDAFYENVQGFVVLFRYGRTIELLDANDRFYTFFGLEKSENPVALPKGANQVIDGLYANSPRFLHKKTGGFELPVKDRDGRTEYYSVRTMSIDFPAHRDFYAICSDISDEKRLYEQLEQEKDRYRIALECASDTLFEYNKRTDVLISFGVFGNDIISKDTLVQTPNYMSRLDAGERVHPDDREKVKRLLTGRGSNREEIRVVCRDRKKMEYKWALAEAGTVIREDDGSEKLIGKLSDINDSKMEELKRREMLYIDKVTESYNAERMEYLIEQHADFARNDEYAILILNVDGFRRINEEFGINFGDALLSDIASEIRKMLRKNDVLARVGSDEFMILIKDSASIDLYEYCRGFCDELLNDYFGNIEGEKVSISGGYSVNRDGADWRTIASRAKLALSFVKATRRGSVKDYINIPDAYVSGNEGLIVYESTDIGEKESDATLETSGMISLALDVLERNKNPHRAMDVLLMRIIKLFHLTSISVFETDFSMLLSTSLHRVVGNVVSQNTQINHHSEETLRSFFASADEDGFMLLTKNPYEAGINNFHEIYSVLNDIASADNMYVRLIYNNGMPKGFIVFGFLSEELLRHEERNRLSEISKIIATQVNKTSSDNASQMKSDFLSRMSHEIRTPMNAIIGMTQIAENCANDPEVVKNSLQKIEQSTKYLLSLINDILDMSKIESGKAKLNLEKVSLSKLMQSIDVLIRPQAEDKEIKFTIISDFVNDYVYADEIKLTQVIVNLVGNALKFTRKKGKIMFRVEQMLEEDDAIVYRFLVKDNGIGIDGKNLNRIFRAFEQATDDTGIKYGGTGLGLAISSNLVQLMGGHINVESKPGKGSEFSFHIALKKYENTEENGADEDSGKTSEDAFDFSGKRILIAEDNELNAEIASTILTMGGFETEVAENGKIAVEKYKKAEAGYFDAILMDIRMPVMDGLEAAAKIRSARKKDALTIPIIAMTANAFDEDMEKSFSYGMNAHLSKPIDTKLLYTTLSKTIKEKKG